MSKSKGKEKAPVAISTNESKKTIKKESMSEKIKTREATTKTKK